jgi:hypothetical protein
MAKRTTDQDSFPRKARDAKQCQAIRPADIQDERDTHSRNLAGIDLRVPAIGAGSWRN